MNEASVQGQGTVQSRSALHTLVLDSLADLVAIIDATGTIVDLNAAWLRFARINGVPAQFTRVGGSYLELLTASGARGDAHVAEAARGILGLLAGKRHEFRFEYETGGPGARSWVLMRASRFDTPAEPLFVVSHFDITDRRRAEDEAWQLAHHDPLTGLANRRHFDETLEAEMRRSMRRGAPISLIELDVDSFKEYNDNYGHVAGDRCLVRIAEVLLRYSRRPGDLAARLGGDEFVLILGDTSYAAAGRIAQGLRHAVEALGMRFGSSGRPITVSIGVATCGAPSTAVGQALFDAADRALYRAKSAGRNRAVQERVELGPYRRHHGGGGARAIAVS